MAYDTGKKLGNYQLLKLLGQGGFADVYLGEHVYLKSLAAIKVLRVRLDEDALHHFLTEARTIAHLKHPHIVSVHDFGMEEDDPFLVMDYAAHGSLRGLHPVGSVLAPTTVLTYVKAMSEALDYAHERKIIHRDVKPENMLLSADERLLLSDFGIALTTQSLPGQASPKNAPTHNVMGTTTYMAPELFVGTASYLSDQYSLAVVAYEWLCGKPPFKGSDMEVALQHVHVATPSLRKSAPDLPAVIEEVIMKALAKDPLERYASILDFATALEVACASAPMSATARARLMLPGGAGPETSLRIRALSPGSPVPHRSTLRPPSLSGVPVQQASPSPMRLTSLPTQTSSLPALNSLLSANATGQATSGNTNATGQASNSDAVAAQGESGGPASLKLPAQTAHATRRLSDYAAETLVTTDSPQGGLLSRHARDTGFHSDATQTFPLNGITTPASSGLAGPGQSSAAGIAAEMKQMLSTRLTQLAPYSRQIQAKTQALMQSFKQRGTQLLAPRQPAPSQPPHQFMQMTSAQPTPPRSGVLGQPTPPHFGAPTQLTPPRSGMLGQPTSRQFGADARRLPAMPPAGRAPFAAPAHYPTPPQGPTVSRRVVVGAVAAIGVVGGVGVLGMLLEQGNQQQVVKPAPTKKAVTRPTPTPKPTQEPTPTATPVNTQVINTTRPAVATWGVNQFDLFVRGSDANLWHRHYDGTWHQWEVLLGGMAYDPAAVAWSPGRLDVFARGADNSLQHAYYDGNWHPWESLGGILTSDPAVTSWGPNRLDVFVRSIDNGLYHMAFDGAWHPWEPLSGVLASSPTATSWGPNRLDAFVRGSDNALWHRGYDGTWHDWESLGGSFASDPSVVSVGPNHLDVYVRGADGTLSHRMYDGTWHDWESLGGAITSSPTAITWGNGRIDIFSRTQNNELQQGWNDGSWKPWVSLT